jgi:hypothetical protein
MVVAVENALQKCASVVGLIPEMPAGDAQAATTRVPYQKRWGVR